MDQQSKQQQSTVVVMVYSGSKGTVKGGLASKVVVVDSFLEQPTGGMVVGRWCVFLFLP
jgi:hypothetical protein